MKHKIFCYICKKPILVEADNKKDATQKFETFGHESTKTNYMAKDLSITKLNYNLSRKMSH
jgi:hypothetical protein